MPAAEHSSIEFLKQAQSDLRQAQTIAKSDQTGHALGTAMNLNQQCAEKTLKSMLLRLGETTDLPHVPDISLRSLGHGICRDAHRIYTGYVESHKFPHIPQTAGIPTNINEVIANALASNKRIFSKADEVWPQYSTKHETLGALAWKNSLGALSNAERSNLLSFYSYFMSYFSVHAGQLSAPASHLKRLIGHPMHKVVFNHRMLSDANYSYSAYVLHQNQRITAKHTFNRHKEFLVPQTKKLLLTAITESQYLMCAKRIFLEYWFSVFNYFVLKYMELLPHNTYGRYPSKLGGVYTSSIYESQSEYVLFSLFVDTPYHIEQLLEQSERIDELHQMLNGNDSVSVGPNA